MHLQRRVVPSDNASAALRVLRAHDLAEDFLIKGTRADCTKEQDREAVLGHSHLVLTVLHHSIDAKYHGGVVADSIGVVDMQEGVVCIDGEGGRGGGSDGGGSGGGRRHRSGSSALLLGGLLCWKRLHLGRHGGVVVVVGGSIDGGGGGVGDGISIVNVVVDALFIAGGLLV